MTQDDELQLGVLVTRLTKKRITRIILYFFLTLGGLSSIIFPSEILMTQTNSVFGIMWAFLFVLGAATALVGAVTDRWILEFSALPLLFSSFTVFAIALASSGFIVGNFVVFSYAFFYGAFASSLVSRWVDLRALYVAAKTVVTVEV